MKKTRFFSFGLLCFCLLFSVRSLASHIIGGEVRYEYISGNTYRVLLNLYGDCNPSPTSPFGSLATLRPQITIYRDSTMLVDSLFLTRTTTPPQDASPTCPAYLNNTRCNGGTEIGIKIFEYTGVITLPAANPRSSCWRFVFDGNVTPNNAGRSGAIDNIRFQNNNSLMYIYSTLNNTGGRMNSSPSFTTVATPYFCQTAGQSFNPGATDANNDVLTYRAVPALEPGNISASYNAGYAAPYRLATNGIPTFNAATGQLGFNPSQQQRSVVVYLIEEYRNGLRVGSIMREMTFVVVPCNNTAPAAAVASINGGSIQNGTTITICQGQTLSFNLNPTDTQGDTIDVTATGIPTGATYFIGNNGSPTPTSSFTWNTGFAATGMYNFYITYADRACPISARQTIGYSILVVPPPQLAVSVLQPASCNTPGVISIASPAGIPQSIDIMQGTTTVKSYAAGAVPATDTLPAGTYRISASTGVNCVVDTTITILQGIPIFATVTVTDTPCTNDATGKAYAIASGGTGAPYTFRWSQGSVSAGDTVTSLRSGNLQLTVTDKSNCSQVFDVSVPARPTPEINAGPDRILCEGDSLTLLTSGTAVNWAWTPAASLNCTTCPAPVTNTLTDQTYIVSTFFANGCTATDTVFVQVLHPGGATRVGADTTICGGDTAMLFADGGVKYQWTPAGTLTSDTVARPGAFPQTTTRYTVLVYQNQCFADTLSQLVSVEQRPSVVVDNDFTAFSGATTQLTATASGASSIFWTPTVGLSCYQCYAPMASPNQSTTYVATVKNTFGCTASDTVRILITCDGGSYYIANTFTPNGDGRDDWFYPQGKGAGVITRFEVYNRWGNKVFERKDLAPNNPHFGWDGTYNGKALDAGVFTYVMEARCANGTPVYLKGDINLMR